MVAPRVFFDISVDGAPLGRVVFELYNVSAPKTSENFRALCTGEKGVSPLSQQPLYYKNSLIHRSIPDFMIQGGDFTKRNGTGGESIYGAPFADEDLSRPVDAAGLLVMANKGPDTNNSQFFVTLRACPHLTGKHVVFGRVLRGFEDVVQKIAVVPTDAKDRPTVPVVISNCGELELRRPLLKQSSISAEKLSDSESERGRKRRRKHASSQSRSLSRSRARSQSRDTPVSSDIEEERMQHKKRRKERREKKKERKSKKQKSRSVTRSASRSRYLEEGEAAVSKIPREETEEEYDARLEREELERIEATRQRELADIKRRYESEAILHEDRNGKGDNDEAGIRYKGRGRMKYVDPEMRAKRRDTRI
ncbi:cyclophilin-like domain-containing protein [Phellopilus nigrolimitatus]|nr:cyclophilin-like domain-containing protein [Phellopilus nigrolimitatus]